MYQHGCQQAQFDDCNTSPHLAAEMCLPCRLAYPMPPAGADPETWVPEEEPQPIGISISLPHGSILPGTPPKKVLLSYVVSAVMFPATQLGLKHHDEPRCQLLIAVFYSHQSV